jgi:hypothetical protein
MLHFIKKKVCHLAFNRLLEPPQLPVGPFSTPVLKKLGYILIEYGEDKIGSR